MVLAISLCVPRGICVRLSILPSSLVPRVREQMGHPFRLGEGFMSRWRRTRPFMPGAPLQRNRSREDDTENGWYRERVWTEVWMCDPVQARSLSSSMVVVLLSYRNICTDSQAGTIVSSPKIRKTR